MSRKEGNPNYSIAHRCQEKRKIQVMLLLTNFKKDGTPGYAIAQKRQKDENRGYVIAHKCQEKGDIQVMPLLTNVNLRGKSRLCHCSQMLT